MAKGESVNRIAITKDLNNALPHLSPTEANAIIEGIVTCFAEKFIAGEEIKISGFGKFSVADKAPRRGRNPQTGEELTIPGRRVIKFKVSPVLRDELNNIPAMVEHSADHA